jgi:hypothetical protein
MDETPLIDALEPSAAERLFGFFSVSAGIGC